METNAEVIVIGGGQSGLACAYYLRKANIDYLILDDREVSGGAWNSTWDSLKLFSPAEHSSLPGYIMPRAKDEYPPNEHVIKYLSDYEKRYDIKIKRPVKVIDVIKDNKFFRIKSNKGDFTSKYLICATGTWSNPYIPDYKGKDEFQGEQIHSAFYKNPAQVAGKKVMIVGAANSAAQILADLVYTNTSYWVCLDPPNFLPKEIDGRYLFDLATKKYKGEEINKDANLGNIVQVESVAKALAEGKMQYYSIFDHLDKTGAVWKDGSRLDVDVIIWATGFKSAINYLNGLKINAGQRIKTIGTKSEDIENLYFVGFGNWTGFASATLIGVGRTAKRTVEMIGQG